MAATTPDPAAGRRTLAASVTPLRSGGEGVDVGCIQPLVDFYAGTRLDGLLVLGTTGEGVLLSGAERRAAAAAFINCASNRLDVVVHCGAQSTRDTAALAAHAAECSAAGVAVIAPPYYAFDERSLVTHFSEAAAACAPLPFFVYEFAARSGYAVPLAVVHRLRESASNFTGLKVSDATFEQVRKYLLDGLDVYIGAEELIHEGMTHGAAGAVSGLAAALPECVIDAVRTGTAASAATAGALRKRLQRFPFHSALKRLLAMRGVPISADVSAPLHDLDAGELGAFEGFAREVLAPLTARPSQMSALLPQSG
jgi:dihydrodipicolinate synthase/N-acetylneuraminate lyase